ncbi:DUF6771 family protein [Sphingomonas kyeonggiensis]|uniref:Uncharacterized protein n=1 Tax=Sphingomonas kyeonggiensis TaxID=1268553 RepID=A0A7W6JVU8_9SPHN|nr:DUF6771 family protein [Sphingomonas kyeonggiensis]MBB4100481.1 hypothetical protein [Sphingomonas kyeonggiensis]
MADTADLTEILTQVLRQAPQWIRLDLASKEAPRRERAEDALAAMIANAIAETRTITVKVHRQH